MVSAWVHDLEPVNECYPHTGERVDLKFLEKLGIRHFYVDANNVHLDREFQEICRQNSWKQRDLIVITPNIPNADSKLKSFFEEHMHPDEEVRAVLDGSGFFDVRVPNSDDRWIRILVEKGDCISLSGFECVAWRDLSSLYTRCTWLPKVYKASQIGSQV
mmetsp:Transcript_45505/g.75965  ORF Transcript_45505/g.75965 Transcript_45505/m.75965 type:complete len:160 (-) Transcript_45505:484-963(-)